MAIRVLYFRCRCGRCASYLFELLELRVPEHNEPVLARGEVALVHSSPGAGVDGTRVAGGAPVNAVGLRRRKQPGT